MQRKSWQLAAICLCGLILAFAGMQSIVNGQMRAVKSAIAGSKMISGMGSLSGTVTAPKEFKAAKVYAHNLENVVYMVYTVGGKYQAVDLFPGNYEVTVEKSGFNGGEPQKVTVTAGANATADLSMQEGVYRASQQMRGGQPANCSAARLR